MLKHYLLAAALLGVSAGAFAQAPAAAAKTAATPALSAQQKAQIQKQNTQMAQAALQIAQMVDRGQAGIVWDKASSVAKSAVKRADFVRQITTDRAALGAPTKRQTTAITRTQSKGGSLPAGLYINVSHRTQFAHSKTPVRELVSFHLDPDHVWRVAGYTVR